MEEKLEHEFKKQLAALTETVEASMNRKLNNQRVELGQHILDRCAESEEKAVFRSAELHGSRQVQVSAELKEHLRTANAGQEEAVTRAHEVSEQHACLSRQVHQLQAQMDAAAAQIDRLAVQTATCSKDTSKFSSDSSKTLIELRAKLEDEAMQRRQLEATLKHVIGDAAGMAAGALNTAIQRSDQKWEQTKQGMTKMEDRLVQSIADATERTIKEANVSDELLYRRILPEVQEIGAEAERQVTRLQDRSEAAMKEVLKQIREEIEAASKRTGSEGEQLALKCVQELRAKVDDGLENATNSVHKLKMIFDKAQEDAVADLRRTILETRSACTGDAQRLKEDLSSAQADLSLAIADVERRAVDAARKRLEDAVADIHRKVGEVKEVQVSSDEKLRKDCAEQLQHAVSRLERSIEECSTSCKGSATTALSQASSQLRAEMTESFRGARERVDTGHSQMLEKMRSEMETRQQALVKSDAAREALAAGIREDIRRASQETAAASQAMAKTMDGKLETTHTELHSLERSLEAMHAEELQNATSFRAQLLKERQQTEEANSQLSALVAQTRDNLESQSRSDAADMRNIVSEARKRLTDEAASIRKELRDLPSKRDLQAVIATTADSCQAASQAADTCRTRLESSVQDFAGRCREFSSETQDTKNRVQREMMSLGNEVTQLRAATSSLVNGVIKALATIGLIGNEDQPVDDSSLASTENPGRETPVHRRPLEVEDLLQWEKIGRSLTTRISRQWYPREIAGFPTLVSVVEALGTPKPSINEELASTCASSKDSSAHSPHRPRGPAPTASSPKVRMATAATTAAVS